MVPDVPCHVPMCWCKDEVSAYVYPILTFLSWVVRTHTRSESTGTGNEWNFPCRLNILSPWRVDSSCLQK